MCQVLFLTGGPCGADTVAGRQIINTINTYVAYQMVLRAEKKLKQGQVAEDVRRGRLALSQGGQGRLPRGAKGRDRKAGRAVGPEAGAWSQSGVQRA